uniref:3-hydroxyisobutyryl-CoA hydrolase n=1 Tax=Loa loa TaxID=7209 RepID=A0A1I7VHI1_LOALO
MSKAVRNLWFLAAAAHMIKTEKVGDKRNVGLIKLDRPKALNALCNQLMQELSDALVEFDNDTSIGAVVITGAKRVFS